MLDSDTPAENPAGSQTPTPAADAATDGATSEAPAAKKTAKKAAAKKTAAKKTAAKKTAAKKTAAKRTTKKVAAADPDQPALVETDPQDAGAPPAAKKTAAKKATAKKATSKKATTKKAAAKKSAAATAPEQPEAQPDQQPAADETPAAPVTAPGFVAPLFQPPDVTKAAPRRRKAAAAKPDTAADETAQTPDAEAGAPDTGESARADRPRTKTQKRSEPKPAGDEAAPTEAGDAGEAGESGESGDDSEEQGGARRRRRRGGRRRRKGGGGEDQQDESSESAETKPDEQPSGDAAADGESGSATTRRRRRRRRAGEEGDGGGDDPENTVTRVRKTRSPDDEITALSGSTRLEAKKQRRREGREAGRRRAPIVSEAEFLARREAVDRVMVIRQREDLTQIAVLEDKVLVEHYVARESQTSLIGNVYLGKVQNVLPSMEAAFIDIGKGRNAVLYAGEVNWDALGAGNGPRKIEQVLKSGQSVLVQVTKDPVGHKGARLTSQISLPGRFLVYVPDGTTSGISRKLPDTERSRLKTLLKEMVPDSAGVIVRTAAEGASEDELTRDVERLTARWEDISAKVEKGNAPQLLYGEPDLTLKVVRDLFTEDFGKLVVSGDDAWDMVDAYVKHVAPDLTDRLERYDGAQDAFAAYRIDEQIAKALDRKVWLPSGGSLIIDRTEAMTVVDVNTGKFTGSGGNLEETVTKNNLEAAEEIIRQLRLRDIGGIIVVDFIDMVLESNRDLVLRRMVECLGRDRTRHQVAEVTSLGLVQMTRKRIGTGLLEAFSEPCEHCQGRGLIVHHEPVEAKKKAEEEPRRNRRSGRGRGKPEGDDAQGNGHGPSPKVFAAMAGKPADETPADEKPADQKPADVKPRDEKPKDKKAAAVEKTVVEQPASAEPGRPMPGQAAQPTTQPSTQPTQPTETEPEPAPDVAPAPPAPPKVVTSSRRRVASRPAGPPAGASDGSITLGGTADGAPTETATQQAEHTGDGTGDETDGAPVPVAAHVPVKKKGSRKR
ncbi:MAG TPA: Rne/Rng family ribonuclease [Nocardioides sp.]|uniref:Rne/Rng family ribonuclease n=1 Tax=Nocardioides sp. TaxID=35761 RepID=UPI002D7E5087|nr:Rne/Rng family ribonuclease [Nocardioides sp.]HET6653923.1 Rne/Rng family ribonuclease [Nocardioides sp.]